MVVVSTGVLKGQEKSLAIYKSVFTLNFIRYIGWPEAAKQGDFVIGVLRDGSIAKELNAKTVGKKFGYQNIVVKEFKNVDEVTDCQILYVSENINYSKYAQDISSKLNNSNSLIVTEVHGAIDKGSMVNFVIVDQKLKFELSPTNAGKFGLKFSNSLTSMTNAILK